ncbi:DNA repair metallo-beta-lactamase [Xylogone sp. PMI_703]|nr:DNA repair metallo-beta-lactamase [Xylogone sp. PMI_703]
MASRSMTKLPASRSNVSNFSRMNSKRPTNGKTPVKKNTSILSFFKKVDSPVKDDSVFLADGDIDAFLSRSRQPSEDTAEDDIYGENEDAERRYNEAGGPSKKRRLSTDAGGSLVEDDVAENGEKQAGVDESKINCISDPPVTAKPKQRRIGPFLDDSDSEDEIDQVPNTSPEIPGSKKQTDMSATPKRLDPDSRRSSGNSNVRAPDGESPYSPPHVDTKDISVVPGLKQETTSGDDFEGFNSQEFPDEDIFGEEYNTRRTWERDSLEEGEEYDQLVEGGVEGEKVFNGQFDGMDSYNMENGLEKSEVSSLVCPICNSSLSGISSSEANQHVNACLDGNPIPLPEPAVTEVLEHNNLAVEGKTSFIRKAAIPRPGQANPFELGKTTTKASAFSMIMASHAEDNAWAAASAAENAARGKPAYQRTCPFYKILPGFFICVDAFRYGAIQGCNAYFLSHFHSDHYIGLTALWCHGPIYCSKVTANLVKQQLRVDPKWVVPLEFEQKTEVPGTEGAFVTMIPANHCPGSSLFLFEKVVGKGGNPKVHRILHCGDFRACPAHIAHPLLMPDIVNTITGKTTQQKIDVCYLDTTYLNPKYSFPRQEDVIQACAEMCVSLQKEQVGSKNAWEMIKKERPTFANTSINSKDEPSASEVKYKDRGRILVVCGTYSIGKERMCLGIARALDCKIWAAPAKMRICAALEDPELMSRMTSNPREAQIHMQGLMEIRPETLQEYLNQFKPHFSRIIGLKPTGWNYRPPNSRYISPSVTTVLNSSSWKSRFTMAEMNPQRGSTKEAACFGVPYSEHSSFRELTMFVCALRIEKIIPTVNVGTATGRAKMKAWIDKWMAERKKNGCIKFGSAEGEVGW